MLATQDFGILDFCSQSYVRTSLSFLDIKSIKLDLLSFLP